MDEKKEDEVIKDTDLSQSPSVQVSQSAASSFGLVADALRDFREQNATILAEIARTGTANIALAKSIADSAAVAADFSRIIDAQINLLPDLSKVIRSPAYETLLSANFAISNLFDTTDAIAKSIVQLSSVPEMWQSQLQSVNLALEAIQIPKAFLDSHIARISQLSVLAQASLYQLPWERIGDAIQVSLETRIVIQRNFLDLT